MLIDGESYFEALCSAFESAEQRIFIVGWDIDSQLTLKKFPDPKKTEQYRLYKFLNRIKQNKPELEIFYFVLELFLGFCS